jgi:hypothetical protein
MHLDPIAADSVFVADLAGDGDADARSAAVDEDEIAWYPNLGTKVHDDGFDSGASTACWSSSVPPVP